MFEKASRLKLRFETARGLFTAEDLWDLPLTSPRGNPNLDDIAIALNKRLKEVTTESFVTKTTRSNEALQLSFDIVKHVIEVKLAENEEAKKKTEQKQRKDRILEILAHKQDKALEDLPIEELQKLAEAL